MVSHQLASHVVDQAEAMGYLKKTLQRGLHIVFPNPNCRLDNPTPPHPTPKPTMFFKICTFMFVVGCKKIGMVFFHHKASQLVISLLFSPLSLSLFVYLDYYLSVHLPFFHPSLPRCLYRCFSLLLSWELRQTWSSKVHNCSCSLEAELR